MTLPQPIGRFCLLKNLRISVSFAAFRPEESCLLKRARTKRGDNTDNSVRTFADFEIAFALLGRVARPERVELPTFWFVAVKSNKPKC
jgi:hypothetical protein